MPKRMSKTILKILMKFASLVVQKISVSLITVSVILSHICLSSTNSSSSSTATTTQCSQTCNDVKVVELYSNVAGMLDWCIQQCEIGTCPASHCIC